MAPLPPCEVLTHDAAEAAESLGESLVPWHLPLQGFQGPNIRRIFLSLKLKGCLFRLILLDGSGVCAAYHALRTGVVEGMDCKGFVAVFIFIIYNLAEDFFFGLGIAYLLFMVYITRLINSAKMLELGPGLSSLHYPKL